MTRFYPLKVIEKRQLTPESISIGLKIPDNLKDIFQFKPGQFVMIEKEIDGHNLRRYYSIYNTPDEPIIRLGIKLKGADGFADYVMQHLKPGQTLNVSIPMNDVPFQFDNKNPQKLLAITIGSGITPFYSFIQYILKHQPETKLVLVYGNESPEKTMFYQELHHLSQKYPEQLKIYEAFSQSDQGDFNRRISPEVLNEVLQKEDADFDATYIIGPDDLKKMAAKVLEISGISKDKLHYRVYS